MPCEYAISIPDACAQHQKTAQQPNVTFQCVFGADGSKVLLQGWIGGWLLPQEASYFALALPHGWWLFGLDLALVDDIDMCQTR